MDIIKEWKNRIAANVWLCFIASVVFGVIIHFYMLTHKLPNWDDLNNLQGYGSGAEYGRWLLEYIRPLYGEWSIPALNGMLAIFLWAIAAAVIYQTLHLETQTSAVLLGIIVMSFPAVGSTMTYMFTVTCYAVGFLMVCVGGLLYRKYRYGFLPAMLLYLLSLGIYQSYICLAVSILLLGFVLDVLRDNKSFWEVFRDGVKAAATLIVTLLAYLAVSKWFNHDITTDRGLDTMGQINPLEIPRLIMRSYKRISEYFLWKPYSFTTPFTQKINIAICIMIGVTFIYIVIRKQIYKDKLKTVLLCGLMAALPVAMASIYILAPETQDATLMMLHPYFFLYVILLALAENTGSQENGNVSFGLTKIMTLVSAILLLTIGYRNYMVTNEAYFRTELAFDRVYAYYNRIMMNVEAMPGYQYGDSVALIGEFYPNPNPLSANKVDDERFVEFSGIAMENGLLTTGSRRTFLQTYLGIELPKVTDEEVTAIKETDAFAKLPEYPAQGAIARINDVWVVKLQ